MITAFTKSHAEGDPFFTLTQNALADGSYLDYLRAIYGAKIYIPTAEDSQNCFTNYVKDALRRLKENRLKPGENVKEVDGQVQVSGQVAVMSIKPARHNCANHVAGRIGLPLFSSFICCLSRALQ